MDAYARLMQVFFDDSGALRFAVDEVRHVIPWVIANMPIEIDDLDDATLALFVERCEEAGVEDGMPVEDVQACLAAYYAEFPPHPGVLAALQEGWREVNASAQAANPFAAFSGAPSGSGVLGGGTRPAGTIPGGLARLATVPPKPAK